MHYKAHQIPLQGTRNLIVGSQMPRSGILGGRVEGLRGGGEKGREEGCVWPWGGGGGGLKMIGCTVVFAQVP